MPRTPAPRDAALMLFALAACAGALDSEVVAAANASSRSIKSLDGVGTGCLWEGAWYREGAAVATGAACLRCACRLGALACRRRACAPPPAPLPPRCHLRHRRDACCPELHCPDGVTLTEQDASARFEDEEDIMAPTSISHVFPACVEGGSVFAAGSAMRAAHACEQCFCLGGARRCVRPRCLPPPRGCRAASPPGACCPHRYYCQHDEEKHPHDCKVEGKWIPEGELVSAANCSQCFCLRGSVQCHALACAPPLHGCTPLLRAGDCCAHQYHCPQRQHDSQILTLSNNALSPVRNDDRAFHTSRNKQETTTKNTNIYTAKNKPKLTATKNHLVSTTKVKRKTSDPPPEVTSISPEQNTTVSQPTTTATKESTPMPEISTTGADTIVTTTETTLATSTIPTSFSTTEFTTEMTSTDQPENSVRIIINGTINCTAELSSTSLPLNMTFNDTEKITQESHPRVPLIEASNLEKITQESHPRVPLIDVSNLEKITQESHPRVPLIEASNLEKITQESHPRVPLIDVSNLEESHPRVPLIDVSNLDDHTFSANDIITDRTVNGGFDENESFVINVTSSLNANVANTHHAPTNHTATEAPLHAVVSVPTSAVETNSSKKTKGDYDYDYTEPTLPPSLPNLKIIPFVAADAVVDDDNPKETLTYPVLEREDKFPVYYPSVENKESAYVTRREDVYRSTQYPVFITDKPDEQFPSLMADVELSNPGYMHSEAERSGGDSPAPATLPATPPPLTATTFKLEAPAVNLFSPPLQTEGGFVPKGPTGLIEEYFAVYPSTPPGPPMHHLTTSMQLDVAKGECVTGSGRRVPAGASVSVACSECSCAWGELVCAPRACRTPPHCTRRPATTHSGDVCCGDLVCQQDNITAPVNLEVTTAKIIATEVNNMKVTTEAHIEISQLEPQNLVVTASNDTEKVNASTKPENISQIISNVVTSSESEATSINNVTTTSSISEKLITKPMTTTTATPIYKTTTQPSNQSLEYEEDDDDEGFSFGSVLKLLLSDNYETTTTPPKRIPTTTRSPPARSTTTTRRPRPTLPPVLPPKPSIAPFMPLPIHSYIPTKGNQNSINRIDHLVLGEATAIKKTTPRPATTTGRPVTTSRPNNRATTRVAKPTEVTIEESYASASPPGPPPGLGPGLLKLAGCNIYGRMYRVGRIITELSTPCQECWCTELGVQCKQLPC